MTGRLRGGDWPAGIDRRQTADGGADSVEVEGVVFWRDLPFKVP